METLDPRGLDSLDPRDWGLDWQYLRSLPLEIATYQIYKLGALWFQRRSFFFKKKKNIINLCELYILPWQPEFQSNQPKSFMQLFPLPDDALHEI